MSRCRALDKTIYDDALAAGNVKYAEMLAANYRLVMGAHKLFQDDKGLILYFSKENKSGGFVNTVDLTYPECPIYLLYNPTLQKGMMLSILEYALSDERKGKNCAAHDLGIYPQANGMHYGDSMPLEESANMIILANAICRITGDGEWLKPYTAVLKTWAEYCRKEGQNPGNQLCTDDFKGPSEQNTNLSVKSHNGRGRICRTDSIHRRSQTRHREIPKRSQKHGAPLGSRRTRRRPLPHGIPQIRNLEPEIQSRMG